ncbi:MAG: polysaccharide pyruvyl transferase family protein [Odoribacter sp.]
MKIGILTQPLHTNYGGILQAYALQTYLKKLGCEVWLINRVEKVPGFLSRLFIFAKRIVKKYVLMRKNVHLIYSYEREVEIPRKIMSQNTQLFINRYISPCTDQIHRSSDFKKLLDVSYDAFIVGSDQVWRPCYSPCLFNYFFNFLPLNFRGKRMAYAASFGVDEWELSKFQTKRCGKLLRRFDAVSVREESGVDLCKKKFGVSVVHLLDPTMLLTPCDYLQLLSDKKNQTKKLLVYMLDMTEGKKQLIERVAVKFGLTPFYVNTKTEDASVSLQERIAPPVENWLRGFRDATYVVTDSFHGCVFSILFNVPFIVYGNKDRGIARFDSLLKMFCLRERMILDIKELVEDKLDKPVDWVSVDRILNKQRELSKDFLMRNLHL